MTKPPKHLESDEDGYFNAYSRFSGTLRTWLVAYGVGGPALVLTQEKLATQFFAAPTSRAIVVLFLSGVAVQVLAAWLYKSAMWYLYRGVHSEELQTRRTYKAADWLSESYLLETSLDIASIILFAAATYLLIGVYT
jgi:hypothetical protein